MEWGVVGGWIVRVTVRGQELGVRDGFWLWHLAES